MQNPLSITSPTEQDERAYSIFIFESNAIRYGFEAKDVREVFFLPQVEPLPEAPRDIIGAIDLRGRIVPVMDLELRFGFQPRDYQLSDSVVVFESDGILMALVVNAVFAVQDIPLEDFRDAPVYGRDAYDLPETLNPDSAIEPVQRLPRFIYGMAQTTDGVVRLLDCSELVRYSGSVDLESFEQEADIQPVPYEPETSHLPEFCPNATPEERETFRQRSLSLQVNVKSKTQADTLPLAIIEISGQLFGLDLKVVREFCEVQKNRARSVLSGANLGNTNLRGEILTLVSLHESLDLPVYRRENTSNAVVVDVDNTVFGIAIDTVLDVMHLQTAELAPVPTALRSKDNDSIRGVAPYQEQTIGVLDIEAIVQGETLAVKHR